LYSKTNEKLDFSVDMKIETLREDYDIIPNKCPKCGHIFEEIYCRSEKSHWDGIFDLIVFQCSKCHAFYAYWIDCSDDYSWRAEISADMEANPEPTRNQPLKIKGKPALYEKSVLFKKCAEGYSKAISDKTEADKELNCLFQAKLPELYKAGLSLETINFARNKVTNYQKNKKPSVKKIPNLVAAAIYATANGATTDGGLWKRQGEGISERQLEEIFGVTRKTIRRLSKLLL
jgi:hypothetical protein